MRITFLNGLALCLAAVIGCSSAAERDSPSQHVQAAVYGADDRNDVFAEPDATWRARVRGAAVALIPHRYLTLESGSPRLADRPLKSRYVLCEGERFAEQPAVSECSATLIDEDLLLTAGHCFTSDTQCDRYAYVFDYLYNDGTERLSIEAEDVYGCKRIVTRRASTLTSVNEIDYAVVQLDRPVSSARTPLTITRRLAALGEAVVVVGFPSGLPAKIDRGARLLAEPKERLQLFSLDSDTFAGSSGSAVLDTQGELLGVLSRGGADYTYDADAGCQLTRKVLNVEEAAPWEQASYATHVIDALCEAGWPNLTFCGTAPQCGDGFCSTSEHQDCSVDCGPPRCENSDCPAAQDAGEPHTDAAVKESLVSDAGVMLATPGAARAASACTLSQVTHATTSWRRHWLTSLALWLSLRRMRRRKLDSVVAGPRSVRADREPSSLRTSWST